jgi:hypothetical protein
MFGFVWSCCPHMVSNVASWVGFACNSSLSFHCFKETVSYIVTCLAKLWCSYSHRWNTPTFWFVFFTRNTLVNMQMFLLVNSGTVCCDWLNADLRYFVSYTEDYYPIHQQFLYQKYDKSQALFETQTCYVMWYDIGRCMLKQEFRWTVWKDVGFEVLTALFLKVHVIWDRCYIVQ